MWVANDEIGRLFMYKGDLGKPRFYIHKFDAFSYEAIYNNIVFMMPLNIE
tara:strand:- start:4309 stop:4458 length:150 start_codon:yes stop_codon:yes gene_type:complete